MNNQVIFYKTVIYVIITVVLIILAIATIIIKNHKNKSRYITNAKFFNKRLIKQHGRKRLLFKTDSF